MPLRTLARFLANQNLVIEKLSNSFIIRRLAQLTHYTYIKATQAGRKSIDELSHKADTYTNGDKQQQSTFILSRIGRRFLENLQKEVEKRNMK